jgi:hypothetical protein
LSLLRSARYLRSKIARFTDVPLTVDDETVFDNGARSSTLLGGVLDWALRSAMRASSLRARVSRGRKAAALWP